MIKEETKFIDSAVFEGMTSLRAVIYGLEHGISDRKIKTIYLDSSKIAKNRKEIGYFKAVQDQFGYEIREVDEDFLNSLTTGNSHGGIVAQCTERTLPSLSSLSDFPQKGFFVMPEGIEDPYNFGYSLRSLYACGVDGIVLPKRNWMSAAGVVCRSSAGASEMLPLYTVDETQNAVKIFRSKGYQVVCAEEKSDNILGKVSLSLPLLLIVGGEKRGMTKAVVDSADLKVRIPYARNFRASLSAASAATMFAYEIARQNEINN